MAMTKLRPRPRPRGFERQFEDENENENENDKQTPRATYRLQFNRSFTFTDALSAADYLRELGISDAYASPLFQATPGSQHGYDVCDFNRLNEELGGTEAFARFTRRRRELGLGLLLDIVPNQDRKSTRLNS